MKKINSWFITSSGYDNGISLVGTTGIDDYYYCDVANGGIDIMYGTAVSLSLSSTAIVGIDIVAHRLER